MAYCVICCRQHDPDLGCSDGTEQILRDAGIPLPHTRQAPAPQPSRWRVGVYLLVAAAFILMLWWFFGATR